MHPLEAVVLGVIEGISEFLPISSTGHLILSSHLLGIPDSTFLTSFIITIQCGAIAAVLTLYWRSFLNIEILKRLFVAFVPTAIIGFTIYPYVKGFLLGNEYVVVASLFIGGVILILFERWYKEPVCAANDSMESITYKQAIFLGLFQAIAIIPGVSRSGATIVGGLLLGLRRTSIVEFSFLLAVPTMGAATAYDLLKNYHTFPQADISLLAIGSVAAFFSALIALRFLITYVKTHTFTAFGWYRIVIATLFFFIVLY